jgi:hypothetical protein
MNSLTHYLIFFFIIIYFTGGIDAIAATAVGESQKRDGSDPALEELVGTRSSKLLCSRRMRWPSDGAEVNDPS